MSCASNLNMTIEDQDNLKVKRAAVNRRQHHTEQTDRMVAALAIAELSSGMSLPVQTFQPAVEIRKTRRDEIVSEHVVPTNSPIPTGSELANDWSIHDQDSESSFKVVDQNGSPAMTRMEVRHVKLAVMPSRNRHEPNVVKRKMQTGRGAATDGSCSPPKLFCKDVVSEPQEIFARSASPMNQMNCSLETLGDISLPSDILNGLQGGRFVRTSAPVRVPEERAQLLDIPNAGSYKTFETGTPVSSYRSCHRATVPRPSERSEVLNLYKQDRRCKVFSVDCGDNSSIYESHPHPQSYIPTTLMAKPTHAEMSAARLSSSGNASHSRHHTSFYPQNNFPTPDSHQYPQVLPAELYSNAAADIHRRLFGNENAPQTVVRKTSPVSKGTSPVLHRREATRGNDRVPQTFHGQYGSLGRNIRSHLGRGALQNMISSMPISFGDSTLPLEWGKTLSLPPLAFCSGGTFGSLKNLTDLTNDSKMNQPLNLHKYRGGSGSGASRGDVKRSILLELESRNKGSYGALGSIREYYENLGSTKKISLKNGKQKTDNRGETSFTPTCPEPNELAGYGSFELHQPTDISWRTAMGTDGNETFESDKVLDTYVQGPNVDHYDVIDYSTSKKATNSEEKISIPSPVVVKSEKLEEDMLEIPDGHLTSPSSIPDSKLPLKKRKHLGYDHRQFSTPNSPVGSPPADETGHSSDEHNQTCSQNLPERKHLPEQAFSRNSPLSEVHCYRNVSGSSRINRQLHPAVVPDEDGDMPIHIAVAQGAQQVVEQLVAVMSELGVPLDSVNNQRQTPLHLAVMSDQYSLVKLLLMEGASPNVSDRKGRTGIHLAVRQPNIHCLIGLLKYSSQPVDFNAMNYEGLTALHLAIQLGNLEAVRLLIGAGANINAADGKNGRTPLYYAAEENRLDLADMLLASGAHPALPSYSGCTPLLAATARSHDKMVALLERYGGVCDIDRAAAINIKEHKNLTKFTVLKQQKLPSP